MVTATSKHEIRLKPIPSRVATFIWDKFMFYDAFKSPDQRTSDALLSQRVGRGSRFSGYKVVNGTPVVGLSKSSYL
jgi:hypothetical protein